MFRNLLLPALAVASLTFAGVHIARSGQAPPRAEPSRPPPSAAYARTVAGGGVVEPGTELISLGTTVGGVVEQALVRVGDRFPAGQPLFRLDARHVQAELAVRERSVAAAAAQVTRLKESPRAETLPPARARAAEAAAMLAQAKDAVRRAKELRDMNVTNEEDFIKAREGANAAQARLAVAEAELALLLAGAWGQDRAVAAAALAEAEAKRDETRIELDRYTVRAPTLLDAAGRPLELRAWQVNVRPGERVDAQSGKALATLGGAGPLNVRVDIDEHDIPRFRTGAPAIALVRGGDGARLPLRFERVEPQVIPKRSLTGDSAERVDTRVLQALFSLPENAPVHVGQQVDVYVDLAPGSAEQ